jgi:DNA-binding LytR/AlgR family response regulator
MPKAIIIEDEPLAARRLKELVAVCAPEIDVITQLSSVKAAVQWFKEHAAPDLVFMDIHLDDGESFAIFNQTEVAAPVIFVTAYDDYTLQAFKVNSIDYLLKPINEAELGFALEKFRKLQLTSYHAGDKTTISIENLKKTSIKTRFLVTSGAKMLSIPVTDVAYFYSEDKITFLQTTKNNRYALEYTLDKLMEMLEPEHFFKINRQMIVGIQSIQSIYKMSVNRLKLTLTPNYSKEILVSIEKYTAFKDWLDR